MAEKPSSPIAAYTGTLPCSHLAAYRKKHGVEGFASLFSRLRRNPKGRPAPIPACDLCSAGRARLYLCLVCSSISCLDHSISHAMAEIGHEIAVDVDRSELFCCSCGDQVYDPDFDMAVTADQIEELPKGKRRRPEKIAPPPAACRRAAVDQSGLPWGLRGMNNLGNTCFMNSVLQVLLHTPPLVWYFLGDHHSRELCGRRRRRKATAAEEPCLACDLDGVFSAAFSGDRTPYSPAQFLHSWWQHAANLASYEQQDAHEFFISVLDWLHCKEQPKPQTRGGGDCRCIAHRVFSGVLRSDVTCSVCGFTSTTDEPCVDIPLDLPPISAAGDSASTLADCLDLFTRPENLGSDQKLHCRRCNRLRDSLKQMSVRRLPPALCFHVKRFEHSRKPSRRTPRKLDQHLDFPFYLDMAPYLSSSIARNGLDLSPAVSPELSPEYEVFAIVAHAGKLEGGHFVTYLRLREMWYKCDDAWVTQVSDQAVRESQAYMMFYVQKNICFAAGEDVACLSLSPATQLRSATPVGELFLSASACG